MIIAALALAAHWATMDVPRKGVSFGKGQNEYLIVYFPEGDCRQMRVFKSPHMQSYYSDIDKARQFLWKSKFCQGGR